MTTKPTIPNQGPVDPIIAELATGDLEKELSAWIEWMWDSNAPPSDELTESAIETLKNRPVSDSEGAVRETFIEELNDYLKM